MKLNPSINERIELEKELIAFLFKTARAAGFIPQKVWDGGEFVWSDEDKVLIEAVFSVDECTAYFKHPDKGVYCAVIVLGNDGWDAISDCSMGPGWDDVIKAVEDRFDPEQYLPVPPVDKQALAIRQLEIMQTNLNKGMSKSIQKLMARSIGEVLREMK